MNKFRLRPAYGRKELLIEFTTGAEKDNFISILETALNRINAKITGSEDLWMNDEILFKATSDLGSFSLSLDSWGLAFIMATENQTLISEIDSILEANQNFEKEEVDFKNYELKNE